MKKKIELKRCLICRKVISSYNESNLCSYHYLEYWRYWRQKGMSAWLEKLRKENIILSNS